MTDRPDDNELNQALGAVKRCEDALAIYEQSAAHDSEWIAMVGRSLLYDDYSPESAAEMRTCIREIQSRRDDYLQQAGEWRQKALQIRKRIRALVARIHEVTQGLKDTPTGQRPSAAVIEEEVRRLVDSLETILRAQSSEMWPEKRRRAQAVLGVMRKLLADLERTKSAA